MRVDGILAGRRIFLVEDQFIIAMEMERALKQAGCVVIGPVGRLKAAMEVARTEAFDFAVLDVNLFGEWVFPVADILESRGIPLLLATGYGLSAVPKGGRAWPVVAKPYDAEQVLDYIIEALHR